MPQRPVVIAPPRLDLRDVPQLEARARAFSAMFKVKPGHRVSVLTNHPDVEREILTWAEEIGHRYLKTVKVEDNGHSHAAIELIKADARR